MRMPMTSTRTSTLTPVRMIVTSLSERREVYPGAPIKAGLKTRLYGSAEHVIVLASRLERWTNAHIHSTCHRCPGMHARGNRGAGGGNPGAVVGGNQDGHRRAGPTVRAENQAQGDDGFRSGRGA